MSRTLLLVTAASLIAAGVPSLAAAQTLPTGTIADRVVVEKAARTLSLYRGLKLLKAYKVALGKNPKGHKEREGDGRTPEGTYVVDFRKADSKFHRALHISYPTSRIAAALARAAIGRAATS